MSLADTIVQDYSPSEMKANELIRFWRRTKTPSSPTSAFLPGNIIYTRYAAVTPMVYDLNPVVIIIRANKRYVFGINVNWLSRLEKTKLLKFLMTKQAHKKSRLEMIPIIRSIRRFKFTKKAYRLYHRKELARPRVYKLTSRDLYDTLTRNMLKEYDPRLAKR